MGTSKRGKAVPLREWIKGALESIDVITQANESCHSPYGNDFSSWPADIRRSVALSSDTYLTPALEIAKSLADQVCEAEEDKCKWWQLLPIPGSPTWADHVAVHLSTNNSNPIDTKTGEELLQPPPLSDEPPSDDSTDIQDVFHSFVTGEPLSVKEDDASEEVTIGNVEQNGAPFLNVAMVEILPSSTNGNGNINPNDEMRYIYSMGIVFYEIFSGGQIPSKLRGMNASHSGDDEPTPQHHGQAQCPDQVGDIGTFFNLDGKLSIIDDEDDCRLFGNDRQIPNKKRGHRTESMKSISTDPLRMKGLPTRLCDLIDNMLDCINGDLTGDETYRHMSDVCIDLQLMLVKPTCFLHGIEEDKLALDKAILHREIEFSTIQSAYKRSISNVDGNCFAIITGPSGIGKSLLARRLGSFINASGGFFLSAKFDQLQHAKPFSALASAFNEYCVIMSEEGRSSQLELVASKLRMALGSEAPHLIKVIPNLANILGDNINGWDDSQDCVDAQRRLQYLLCQFVDVISSFSGAPVTLFLDDLQWADEASINAISQLLVVSGSSNSTKQFFFLGSSREDGMLQEHPFGKMLTSVKKVGSEQTTVKLVCMDKETMNSMVSDLLCLSPRLTRTLSEILFHRTKGNTLFFSQLMASLQKDGLIRLDLSRRRWEWDEEKIQSRKLPDDVAEFISSNIGRLPKEVQDVLSMLSCLGASTEYDLIKALEIRLDMKVIEPLDVAVKEGILHRIGRDYSFVHDRLQEAAYNLIQPHDQCLRHLKYGLALVPCAIELNDDGMLFCAASQINRGGPAAVTDAKQALLMANLNLSVGQKAMEMSDFISAFTFFDNGISFLRKRHWVEHYDLSLNLFESASKCALVTGELVSFRILSEQVMTHAKSFEAKLNTMYLMVNALASASRVPESVEMSLSVLSELGEPLPESLSETETKQHIEQTKLLLQGYTDDELIRYKRMDNPSRTMALKFLARLETSLQMTNPQMQPIVTLKIVHLSIAYGMSPISPVGFIHFGQILVKLGDTEVGCRYLRTGKKLLDKLGSKEVAGECLATFAQVISFIEPVQSTIDFHDQGHANAIAAGDIHMALYNTGLRCGMLVLAGKELSFVSEQFVHAQRLMEEHNHFTWLAHTTGMERNVKKLMGTLNATDFHNDVIKIENGLKDANPHASMFFYSQMTYISFMFRQYEQTKSYAEKFFEINLQSWAIVYLYTNQVFMGGLASFWIYRQTNDPKWAARGKKAKLTLKKWAESSRHNFLHKMCLLKAEECFCDNDIKAAKLLYEKAISSAREHRFVHDEGLACECAAYFFMRQDNSMGISLGYFLQAHKKYVEWGAIAKANEVFAFVQENMSSNSGVDPSSTHVLPYPQIEQNGGSSSRKRGSNAS